jgi:hypothetical protein
LPDSACASILSDADIFPETSDIAKVWPSVLAAPNSLPTAPPLANDCTKDLIEYKRLAAESMAAIAFAVILLYSVIGPKIRCAACSDCVSVLYA